MPDEDSQLEEQIESSDSLQNGEEATGEKPGVEGRDKSKLIIPIYLPLWSIGPSKRSHGACWS